MQLESLLLQVRNSSSLNPFPLTRGKCREPNTSPRRRSDARERGGAAAGEGRAAVSVDRCTIRDSFILKCLLCNVARPTLLQLVAELRSALAAAAEKVDQLEEKEKDTAAAHKKEARCRLCSLAVLVACSTV